MRVTRRQVVHGSPEELNVDSLGRTLTLGVVGLLALPVLLSACSSSPPSATDLLNKAATQIGQAQSVSFSDVTHVGSSTETLSGSLSAAAAVESSYVGSTLQLEVRLVGTNLYVYSPVSTILQNSLGLSTASAQANVNKWIELLPTDSPYGKIITSLSINSVVSIYMPGTNTAKALSSSKLAGKTVIPVTSFLTTSNGTQRTTIYLDASTSLPAGGSIDVHTVTVAESKVAVFHDWNARVSVSAPSAVTAFTALAQ